METTKNTKLQNHIGNKKFNTQPTQSSLGQCLHCRGGESRGAGWRLCQAPPWHGVWGSLTPSQAALPKESLEAPGHLCVCRLEDADAHCAHDKTSSHLVTAQVISPFIAMQILVTWELAARTLGAHLLEPSSNTFSKIQAVQTRLLKICWRRNGLNLTWQTGLGGVFTIETLWRSRIGPTRGVWSKMTDLFSNVERWE